MKLSLLISELNNAEHIDIHLFDSEKLFNKIMAAPQSYGIVNTTDSCLKIDSNPIIPFYLSTQLLRETCTDASKFMFWDTIHPTTIIHKILANEILADTSMMEKILLNRYD